MRALLVLSALFVAATALSENDYAEVVKQRSVKVSEMMKTRIGPAYNFSAYELNPILTRRLAETIEDEDMEYEYLSAESIKTNMVFFNVSDIDEKHLAFASLHVYIRTANESIQVPALFKFTVVEQHTDPKQDIILAEMDVSSASLGKNLVIELTIKDIERWREDPSFEGLKIQALINKENMVIMPSDNEKNQMFLKLGFFSQGTRIRRSVCSLETKSEGCCMYDVWMKPSDFGIENVIAPRKVNVRACAGTCYLQHNHATDKWGSRMARILAEGREPRFGEPCCYPSEFDSFKMITAQPVPGGQAKIVIQDIDGLVISKCTCA